MSIRLEDLDYQRKAVDAVVKVLEGTPRNTIETVQHNARLFGNEGIHSNVVDFLPFQLAENKKRIIAANGIPEEQAKLTDELDFCIEMETGTGKTIVYLRTIYELHRAYKLSKFIILVPSVPIREGVLASFRDFAESLNEQYGFPLHPFEYDSKKINRLRGFIEDPHPQVMIMTIQSFKTDDNILNRKGRDDSFGDTSFLEALGKCHPVIIMDEPQEGMDTELSQQRIETLQPAARIRYSATHKNIKNLLYRLTPAEAYRENLVKKIEVLSVIEQNDEATLKLEFAEFKPSKNGGPPKAKLNAWCLTASGIKWKSTKLLKKGDDLEKSTKNVSYRGYTIERIWKDLDDGQCRVRFTNGIEIIQNQRDGDRAGLFRLQLHYLIRRHYEKKPRLTAKGIKPLSLVFIDKVANYMGDQPLIRNLFEEELAAYLKAKGKPPTAADLEAMQGYYFAQTGKGDYTDSTAAMLKNKEMFNEILRDKDALLDAENPREFIFTHSALGVGWDNPNVFNIATLNTAYDENRKRQEIGRGLRICRNNDGHRVYDPKDTVEGKELNLLTIVPNETYETFATQYQQQIIDDFGSSGDGAKLRKNHLGKPVKKKLRRNENLFGSAEFKAFWDKLARKTDYTVAFDEAKLIDTAADALNKLQPHEYQAQITATRLTVDEDDNVAGTHAGSAFKELRAAFSPLDLVEELSEQTGLAYPTVFRILAKLTNPKAITANPARFLNDAAAIIKQAETEELIRSLSYKPTGESMPLTDLEQVIETFRDTTETKRKGIYDGIVHDSEPERSFAIAADADTEVVCFLKLPSWYQIPIPFGKNGSRNYNPDFGLVLKRRNYDSGSERDYYFVIETKGTNNLNDTQSLTEDERLKIRCALKHFEALGIETQLDYGVFRAPVAEYQRDFKAKAPSPV